MTWDYTIYRRITFGITKKTVGLHVGLQKKSPSDYTRDYKKDHLITTGLQKRSSDYRGIPKKIVGLQRDYMRIYSDYIGIILRLHRGYNFLHRFPKKRKCSNQKLKVYLRERMWEKLIYYFGKFLFFLSETFVFTKVYPPLFLSEMGEM